MTSPAAKQTAGRGPLRIAVGSDHAALEAKNAIVRDLRGAGIGVEDLGTHTSEPVDYPDVAEQVSRRVVTGGADRGIVLCGTGIGVSIAANKVPGIRAALCGDVTTARLARRHNDANVLCLGARISGSAVLLEVVKTWLATEFEGGRHRGRVEKISALEAQANMRGTESPK